MTQQRNPLYNASPNPVPTSDAATDNPSPPAHPIPESAFTVNSFIIEDSFYRSRSPQATHWSVPWSDLMMTMFILFLSMFVYQASHKEFLVDNSQEIIGGSTTDGMDISGDMDIIVPIVPIIKKTTSVRSGTVKKVDAVHVNDVDIDNVFHERVVFINPDTAVDETVVQEDIIEPAPLGMPEFEKQKPATIKKETSFSEMYDMSKQALSQGNLDKFASIELIPDKTMRIVLTGDLLFGTGQADLSSKARSSLTKLAAVIAKTPYMINIIGHTDNQPMHSSRFFTNWELSVVRASSVARFLIEEMGMNPKQFVVSGYGSNRPRRPNTNVQNRAANRRVEIVISKRLAPAVKATSINLL